MQPQLHSLVLAPLCPQAAAPAQAAGGPRNPAGGASVPAHRTPSPPSAGGAGAGGCAYDRGSRQLFGAARAGAHVRSCVVKLMHVPEPLFAKRHVAWRLRAWHREDWL